MNVKWNEKLNFSIQVIQGQFLLYDHSISSHLVAKPISQESKPFKQWKNHHVFIVWNSSVWCVLWILNGLCVFSLLPKKPPAGLFSLFFLKNKINLDGILYGWTVHLISQKSAACALEERSPNGAWWKEFFLWLDFQINNNVANIFIHNEAWKGLTYIIYVNKFKLNYNTCKT